MIAISRQMGSGGGYLAQRLSRRLGIAYVDRQILKLAAVELGIKEEQLAERDERIQSFWDRLLQSFASGVPDDICSPPPLNVVTDRQLFETENRILDRLAAEGPSVILGHGAFARFRNRPSTLRVFVHADRPFRLERIRRFYGAPAAEADAALDRSDQERERFVKERTGACWHDARNYHLAIDLGRVGFERAERIVLEAVAGLDSQVNPAEGP
jgi:cytidylate kinase